MASAANANILVLGSGGREHALVWKLAQSPRVRKIYAIPGNPGIGKIAECVVIEEDNIGQLIQFAERKRIDLTVVGPENFLALGVVNAFQYRGLKIFGPRYVSTIIERSKAFSRGLMGKANVPTVNYEVFSNYLKALKYVRKCGAPIVVKASGLAQGKGVYVCQTLEQAKKALKAIMVEKIHREAGNEVVVEEFIEGEEISIHAFCDGKTFSLFPFSQDHKSIGEGDTGDNTGGMGTVAPVHWVRKSMMQEVEECIVKPTLGSLVSQGRRFSGLLYPGIMWTEQGPKVLEFNVRFGDPEAQVYMRLLKTDLLDPLEACAEGNLEGLKIEWYPRFAACVVIASGGYPGKYEAGFPIFGIDEAEKVPDVTVFHAGTRLNSEGSEEVLRTSGGRVLNVTAVGDTLKEALLHAYEAVRLINFQGMYYRKDIGAKALRAI